MISFERANLFSRVTLLTLVGLVLVPLLVAGGFLWATWTPTPVSTRWRPR